jgi:hypothetical protein
VLKVKRHREQKAKWRQDLKGNNQDLKGNNQDLKGNNQDLKGNNQEQKGNNQEQKGNNQGLMDKCHQELMGKCPNKAKWHQELRARRPLNKVKCPLSKVKQVVDQSVERIRKTHVKLRKTISVLIAINGNQIREPYGSLRERGVWYGKYRYIFSIYWNVALDSTKYYNINYNNFPYT